MELLEFAYQKPKRQFKVGDRVRLGDTHISGCVVATNLSLAKLLVQWDGNTQSSGPYFVNELTHE
jgi:hypothetical protein